MQHQKRPHHPININYALPGKQFLWWSKKKRIPDILGDRVSAKWIFSTHTYTQRIWEKKKKKKKKKKEEHLLGDKATGGIVGERLSLNRVGDVSGGQTIFTPLSVLNCA